MEQKEKLNRLIIFLSIRTNADCIFLEKPNFEKINYFLLHLVSQIDKETLIILIKEYIETSDSFNFSYIDNNIIYLMSGTDISIKLFLDNKILFDLETVDVIYNPKSLQGNDKEISLFLEDVQVKNINNMLINFDEFIDYYRVKDYVLSFCALNKANSNIISFLSIHYLGKETNRLTYVYSKMTKKNFSDFEQYQRMLKVEKQQECSKMMIWFINDYMFNLPISIVSRINLDYFFDIKSNIVQI